MTASSNESQHSAPDTPAGVQPDVTSADASGRSPDGPTNSTSRNSSGNSPLDVFLASIAPELRLRTALVIVLMLTPVLVITLTPLKHEALLFFLGMIPSMLARSLKLGLGLVVSALATVLTPIAILASHSAPIGTGLMTAMGALVALSSLRGWNGPTMYLGVLTGILLTQPPPHLDLPEATEAVQLFYPALLVLLGGLWAHFLLRTILAKAPTKPAPPVAPRDALLFGISLCLLLGPTTFVAMTWLGGTHAGWALMTILVVVKPDYSTTTQRIWHRTLGTLSGGVIAALLAAVVHAEVLLLVIGVVLGLLTVWMMFAKVPYYLLSMFITPTIVLLNSTGGGSTKIYDTDLERVVYTILAAALIFVLIGLGHLAASAYATLKKFPAAPAATD